MLHAAVRRPRLRGKQPPPARPIVPPEPALQAIADEGWSELTALAEDLKRKHVHWTHIRTMQAEHRQPESLSRAEFWELLCDSYRDVYPEAANKKTGSIVLFGLVVKERHGASQQEPLRAQHHHCATYCSKAHYWRAVAKRALEKRGLKLHAACHEGYASMYVYLRFATPRKPAMELDQTPFFSEDHPRGDLLQRLLETSAHAACGHKRFHGGASTGGTEDANKRFRPAEVYEFTVRTGVRTYAEFLVKANDAASQGDKALAEFCTVHSQVDVQQYLDQAWAVREAPQRALLARATRLDRLKEAAGSMRCVCAGVWIPGAYRVLALNGEDARVFGHDVCRAFSLGARRGANMAVVGRPGCGKSMLFEWMDQVFRVSGKPQRENSFALAGVLDAEVLLWQEFSYNKKAFAFEDLLSVLAGEQVEIRVPNARPVPHKNTAPMFYTARAPLSYKTQDMEEMADYNQAVSERFTTRRWATPLPMSERRMDFPACAPCAAKFFLENAAAHSRAALANGVA